jgi:hypothetical protein
MKSAVLPQNSKNRAKLKQVLLKLKTGAQHNKQRLLAVICYVTQIRKTRLFKYLFHP